MPTPTVINKYRYSDVINRRYWDDNYFFDSMQVNPGNTKVGGGAAAGAASEVDVMITPDNAFEYFTIVGNTNLGPSLDGVVGLNLAPAATATHGIEYNTGQTVLNPFTFLIDQSGETTPAFFLTAQFTVAAVTGVNIYIGFRKVQANAAALSTYTDFASIGIFGVLGHIENSEQIATGGVVVTDTTQLAVNATQFVVSVLVDSFGNVTYQLNGSTPTVSPTIPYQFADGLTVMPFIRVIQQVVTSSTASCNYFECGYQS